MTAATTCSVGTSVGLLTAYTGRAFSGIGLTTLQSSVSAWLSHTLHLLTIYRMGISGGTPSRCRRRSQFEWPVMNRSQIRRVQAFGPIPPKALTASVSSATVLTDPRCPIWQFSQTNICHPPTARTPHRFGPQSGARPKPFGLNLPTPVPGKPPPQPRSQPRADLSNLQPADLTTSLMDTIARLQSEVYTLKFAPPVPPTPTPWTQPAQLRPASF